MIVLLLVCVFLLPAIVDGELRAPDEGEAVKEDRGREARRAPTAR